MDEIKIGRAKMYTASDDAAVKKISDILRKDIEGAITGYIGTPVGVALAGVATGQVVSFDMRTGMLLATEFPIPPTVAIKKKVNITRKAKPGQYFVLCLSLDKAYRLASPVAFSKRWRADAFAKTIDKNAIPVVVRVVNELEGE